MDAVIQRSDKGDFGQIFKLSPMTDEKVVNKKSCFQINGTKEGKVKPQASLPDTGNFQVCKSEGKFGNFSRVLKYDVTKSLFLKFSNCDHIT